MSKLKVDIVTAERLVYSEEVDGMILPGPEGELGLLPSHAPLLTLVQPGVLRVVKGNEEIEMAVAGGFVEVLDNRVTILADSVERAEEIDQSRGRGSAAACSRAFKGPS